VLSILMIAFCVVIGQAFATPLLRLPEETFDFGFVEEGAVLEHEFILYNDGTEPLLIKDILPT